MKFFRNYKIEQEPNISHVHVAYPHKSRFMYEPGFSISNSTQTSEEQSCSCPDIFICDDDIIQHHYYSQLFSKLNASHLSLCIMFSGKELVSHFLQKKKCMCQKPKLIITDFGLGPGSWDGIEVTHTLRVEGYSGPIIIRTAHDISEIKPLLKLTLDTLNDGGINHIFEKSDHLNFLGFVEKCLG